MDPVQNNQATSLSSFVWNAANELWGDFKHTDFARIIIPLLLLRRMECVLEPTKSDVLKAYASEKDSGMDLNLILPEFSKLPFYNTSQYSLGTVGSTHTRANLEQYVSQFSPNIRMVFEEFGFNNTWSGRLLALLTVLRGQSGYVYHPSNNLHSLQDALESPSY